jgi:HAD superfamily hydrolase (TIGR01509 family)
MNKSAVIFDWDNLLVPTHMTWLEANQQTLAKYDKTIDERKFIDLVYGTDIIRFVDAVGLDRSLAETIQKQRNDLYGILLQDMKWMEGAEDLLLELRSRSIPTGVVSHARRQNIRALDHLKHDRFFTPDVFICQDDLGEKKKPNPFGLLKVAEVLKIAPNHCSYIGDLESDRAAAKNAGMKSIIIPNQLTENGVAEKAWKAFPDLIECRIQLDKWLAELQE